MVDNHLNIWKTIVITSPDEKPCEACNIARLLDSGAADIVHIRKPAWTAGKVRDLIARIPERLHPRLRLHDQFELLQTFPLICGVHINSRQKAAPLSAKSISRSTHSANELSLANDYDYVTISPIYDSISKPGYSSILDSGIITAARQFNNVIALGGVTPRTMPFLAAAGFAGAALLGYIWDCQPAEFENRISAFRRYTLMLNNFRLQFITDSNDVATAIHQAEEAIAGGCRWIQIRMKDAPDSSVREVANHLLPQCHDKGVVMIIDDRVNLVSECRADGVHLGKNDISPIEARKILGSDKIIGSTANSFEDIQSIVKAGASDYIGLGPFRFTTTKKNLAPVLGLEGYKSIFRRMEAAMLHIPIVAIGGITPADIPGIILSGADGIAVSGAICHTVNPVQSTREIINILHNIANQ